MGAAFNMNQILGKKRLNKLDRMTPEQKAAEAIKFWAAPDDAPFSWEVVAIVTGMSPSWLQSKRTHGGGIKFCKPDGKKIIYYLKKDVLDYMTQNPQEHT